MELMKRVLSDLELMIDKLKAIETTIDHLDQRVHEIESEIEVDPDFDLEEWDD
jgi:hypothetical protein